MSAHGEEQMSTTSVAMTPPKYQQPPRLPVSCDVCDAMRPCVRAVVSCGCEVNACHVCLSQDECFACAQESDANGAFMEVA